MKGTILIIEDDAGLIELLNESIQDAGFDTVCILSAHEAFKWLESNVPILILLDYSLPDMTGKEFIAALKTKMSSIPPFILATGQGDERIAVDMMKLGAKDYIVKDRHFLEMIPLVVARICTELEMDSKLKFTEKALDEAHEFSKQIIDSAQEGVVVYNSRLEIVVWNPFMVNLTGLTLADVSGKSVLVVFPFMAEVGLIEIINKALQGEPVQELEFSMKHLESKNVTWISDVVSTLRNADGEIIGAISTVRDITDRKLTEENLRISEEKFRNVFEYSIVGKSMTSIDGRITVNKAFSDIVGYSKEELEGMPWSDLTHEEDIAYNEREIQSILNAEKQSSHWEKRYYHKDGHIIWVHISTTLLRDSGGKPMHFITEIYDITHRKQAEELLRESEERYRMLAQNINDVIWKMSLDGKFKYISPSVYQLRGYTPEEVMGQTITEIICPESIHLVRANLKKSLDDFYQNLPPQSRFMEIQQPCKDGTRIWTESSAKLVLDEQGEPAGYVGVSRNITERKRIEGVMRESEELFKTISENSINAICTINENGKFEWFNKQILNISGYTAEQISSVESFVDFLAPESVAPVTQNFKNLLNGEPYTHQNTLYFVAANGEKRLCDKFMTHYIDRNGKLKLIVIMNDITDRVQAEQQIRDSEAKFRSITEQTADLIAITNSRGIVIYASPAAQILFNILPEEMCGRNFIDFVADESIADGLQEFENLLRNKERIKDVEFRMKRADGSLFYGEVNGSVYSMGDEDGTLVVIHDVSERKLAGDALKASEDKYRTMIENSNDIIWTLDLAGNFVFVNQIGLDATGLTLGELIGNSFLPLLAEEDIPRIMQVFERAIEGESSTYELRVSKRDNTPLTMLVNTSPIYIAGKVEGVVSFGSDITDRKIAEAALDEKMNELMRFQRLTVGRELSMIELKKEVNELLRKLGGPDKYKIVE